MISLNLENSINMQNMELKRSDSIIGLTGNITGILTAITSGGNNVTDTYRGNTYRLFRLDNLSVYLDTSETDWQVTNPTTGIVEDRSVVYIKLETIGVDGNSYIMTSDTNLSNYNSIKPSVVDPGDYQNRSYEPTDMNSLFDVSKGKTPATATIALDNSSNIGTGSTLPYIYLWAPEYQLSGCGVQLSGAAYSDRTKINPPYEGFGDEIIFDTEHIRIS
jgi:hypothetical protein